MISLSRVKQLSYLANAQFCNLEGRGIFFPIGKTNIMVREMLFVMRTGTLPMLMI